MYSVNWLSPQPHRIPYSLQYVPLTVQSKVGKAEKRKSRFVEFIPGACMREDCKDIGKSETVTRPKFRAAQFTNSYIHVRVASVGKPKNGFNINIDGVLIRFCTPEDPSQWFQAPLFVLALQRCGANAFWPATPASIEGKALWKKSPALVEKWALSTVPCVTSATAHRIKCREETGAAYSLSSRPGTLICRYTITGSSV